MTVRADVGDLIAFLDELAKLDPVAMGMLIAARVACNTAVGDHQTVQTSTHGEGPRLSLIPPGEFRVGLLGVINGYAGVIDEGPWKGAGPVAAVTESDGSVSGFRYTGT